MSTVCSTSLYLSSMLMFNAASKSSTGSRSQLGAIIALAHFHTVASKSPLNCNTKFGSFGFTITLGRMYLRCGSMTRSGFPSHAMSSNHRPFAKS